MRVTGTVTSVTLHRPFLLAFSAFVKGIKLSDPWVDWLLWPYWRRGCGGLPCPRISFSSLPRIDIGLTLRSNILTLHLLLLVLLLDWFLNSINHGIRVRLCWCPRSASCSDSQISIKNVFLYRIIISERHLVVLQSANRLLVDGLSHNLREVLRVVDQARLDRVLLQLVLEVLDEPDRLREVLAHGLVEIAYLRPEMEGNVAPGRIELAVELSHQLKSVRLADLSKFCRKVEWETGHS